MSKKIKEIDINSFRAYKDEQKFSFMCDAKKTRIADLVAIYAPNGYGKTSFFDAVEWAITDEIGRFKAGKPIEEELKNEENYILKNKFSDTEYGSIRIIDEHNSVLEVHTRKKKGNMKGDYKSGNIEKISPELKSILDEKATFCTTNLLAHDKITGFLQNYTAEDKTNALRAMWDESNYSEVLDNIIAIYNEVDKRAKQIELDIKKEEKELKKYKYENEQINIVREQILNYGKNYNINTEISTDNTAEIEKTLNLYVNWHKKTLNEIENSERVCGLMHNLHENYILFSKEKAKYRSLQQEKIKYENAIKKHIEKEKIDEKKEKITKLHQESNDIQNLMDSFGKYIDLLNDINTQNEINKSNILELQKEEIEVASSIKITTEDLAVKKSEIDELQQKSQSLSKEYRQYIQNINTQKKYSYLYEKAIYILKMRMEKSEEIERKLNDLQLKLDSKLDYINCLDSLPKEIIDTYYSKEKLKKDSVLVGDNIAVLEANREKMIGLYNKMQQMIIYAKEFIGENHQNECPLCHQKYLNYDELLNQIDSIKTDNTELEKLDKQLDVNKIKKKEIDESISETEEVIRQSLIKLIEHINIELLNEKNKILKLQQRAVEWKNEIDNSKEICDMLIARYRKENIDISSLDAAKSKAKEFENRKKLIEKDVEKCLKEIEKKKNRNSEIEKSLSDYKIALLDAKKRTHSVQSAELYVKVTSFFERNNLEITSNNSTQLKQLVTKLTDQFLKQIQEMEADRTRISMGLINTKDEDESVFNKIQRQISELNVSIEDYLLRCKKILGDIINPDDFENEIKEKKSSFQAENIKLKQMSEAENDIIIRLQSLKEQKMWMDRKEACEQQKIKHTHLVKRFEKLEETKNYVEDFIVTKTNEYFNSDIINEIYNKIDPHPTMTHIKFITQREKQGLKTHIYTYDQSEDNKMAPVLFLSSAQVNILSLCIFLAKVLSEENTTLSTIFMDDPIQHLDGVNLLAFIDLLRTITTEMGRQIIISTHNEQFYKLLKVKMDPRYYPSKFIELGSAGMINQISN